MALTTNNVLLMVIESASSQTCSVPNPQQSLDFDQDEARVKSFALSIANERGELEVRVETASWIARAFIEDMGGEAPYDRAEVIWPHPPEHPDTQQLALHAARDEHNQIQGADSLFLPLVPEAVNENTRTTSPALEIPFPAITTFQPVEGGLKCRVGELDLVFLIDRITTPARDEKGREIVSQTSSLEAFHAALTARNQVLLPQSEVLETPAPKGKKRGRPAKVEKSLVLHNASFAVQTGQEWTALLQSAGDGRSQNHYLADQQSGILRHKRPDAPFFTETILLAEEKIAGHGVELLEKAARELDIDDGLAWLYISQLLAPMAPLSQGNYAGGWVDLDDVARKTLGGYAPNPTEARARREKVWRAIRYGVRAQIVGQRSVPYYDKNSKQEIDTQIYTSPWSIVSHQKSKQLPLFGDNPDEAPLRVELVASQEWTALTTDASTAQYLPFGEILGALPANKAGGAWARVLGLSYINWCRRNLSDALAGINLSSRRELLDSFPSKVAPYRDILSGANPIRALTNWQVAEQLLVDSELIECQVTLYKPATRQNWQETWLNDSPRWLPGALLRPVIEGMSSKVFVEKPKRLTSLKKRRKRDLPSAG